MIPRHALPVALLGLMILGGALAKLRFSLWILGNCESAAPWHYLCADIGAWEQFLDSARVGIPYVDFTREYPAGAGSLFWLLGALTSADGFDGALRLQVAVSLVADLACAGLIFALARPFGILRATAATALWMCLPTVLLISPVRYDSLVAVLLLAGYLAHRRGRPMWAVGLWSVGFTLKWYPVIAIAVQQLAADRATMRRQLPRAMAVAVSVVAAVNAPYIIGDLARHGHVTHWLGTYTFHAERVLAPDTVLGVLELWLGPLPLERYAALFSIGLGCLVLLTRRQLEWAPKVVLVCVALLVLNRIYSPQFNLWFMPPLLLTMAASSRSAFLVLASLVILIDIATIAIFPFLYAAVVFEIGEFPLGGAAAAGGPYTEAFTSAIFLRAFLLLALMGVLYRIAPDVSAGLPGAAGDPRGPSRA
ncbi:MAG: hypothetical protein OXT09_19180 [Myxococcales bacterium]|nr:hypothetical protein [Myxococcales bacterium]